MHSAPISPWMRPRRKPTGERSEKQERNYREGERVRLFGHTITTQEIRLRRVK